jgi:hypothetical protein
MVPIEERQFHKLLTYVLQTYKSVTSNPDSELVAKNPYNLSTSLKVCVACVDHRDVVEITL